MATIVAEDDLAKQISSVLQEERSSIENEKFSMQMTTSYKTLLHSYEVVSKKYDSKRKRAEVVVKISRQQARKALCKKSH